LHAQIFKNRKIIILCCFLKKKLVFENFYFNIFIFKFFILVQMVKKFKCKFFIFRIKNVSIKVTIFYWFFIDWFFWWDLKIFVFLSFGMRTFQVNDFWFSKGIFSATFLKWNLRFWESNFIDGFESHLSFSWITNNFKEQSKISFDSNFMMCWTNLNAFVYFIGKTAFLNAQNIEIFLNHVIPLDFY
jgi:hypothetical protein